MPLLLTVIMVYATVYTITNAAGASYFGDDIGYVWYAHQVVQGTFRQASTNILTERILQIYPMAFFYWAFGANILTSSAWDILAFLCTTIIVFLIGKEVYNEYAGLVAALLFVFFPTVVYLSLTANDNPAMMFFASLAMLGILYGERRKSAPWYFVAGVAAVCSALVMPEGAFIVAVVVIYLGLRLVRKKLSSQKRELWVIMGFLAAFVLLMIFNSSTSGDPFITISATFNFYQISGAGLTTANISPFFYVNTMFPYGVAQTFLSNIGSLNLAAMLNQAYTMVNNTVGFYFYFALLAGIYLAAKREKRAYFVLFWIVVAFLIMELDPYHVSLSPFSYLLQHRLDRYLTLIAPPAVLLIAIACVKLVEDARKAYNKYLYTCIVAAVLLFIITTAIPVNNFSNSVLVYERYMQVEIAQYILTLPNSTRLYYTADQFIPSLMGWNNESRLINYLGVGDCTNILGNSYIELNINRQVYGLNYTPASSNPCTYWVQVPLPTMNVTQDVASVGWGSVIRLYYVPSGNYT